MYHGSDGDDSIPSQPRNYSDSEDEPPHHGHQYPPSSSIRQSSGYGPGPNDGGYGQPHHATSQSYHSQGYGPPPNQNERYERDSSHASSKGKSRERHPLEPSKEERRRPPREPPKYLTYLPGGDPESSTLANANKPGAKTFVGDPRPYMHTDPSKPPEIVERAKRSKTRFEWYWPVEKVYGPDGKRLIPFPYIPDIDGPEIRPGYAPIDENGNFLPYEEDVIREVNTIIEGSQGSQKNRRKKEKAAERRQRNRHSNIIANQPVCKQPPPPPRPNQDYHGREYHHQEQRDRDRSRDRDRDLERDSRYPPPGPSQQYRDPGPPPQHSYHQSYNQPPPPPPSNPIPPQQRLVPMNQPPRKGPTLRILTLLIEDTRRDPGERDQLAEVRVPLKQIEGPDDGFWADANDVCKALQSGPARVDGPAKVYTLRGKYRQYFLRVNSYGEGEYGSANLRVDKDRTLQVVIEAIPVEPVDHHQSLSTPQATPRPMTPMSLSTGSPHLFGLDSAKRKRSDGPRLASAEMHEQVGSRMSPQSVRAASPSKDLGRPLVYPSKKSKHSASLDPDTDMSNARAEPPPWSHTYDHSPGDINPVGSPESVSPSRSPNAGNEMDLDVSAKEQEPDSPSHQHQHPPQQIQQQRVESPPRSRTTSTLPTGSGSHMWTEEDNNLIEILRSQMSKEPGYNDFLEFRSKQLTMREQLTYYTYIMKQLEEHTRGGLGVKKMHVMGVFNLPGSWADMAQETLQLFALYGPGGTEFEDGRIIDMMDEIPPVTGKIQASKFLERLRHLHREQNDT